MRRTRLTFWASLFIVVITCFFVAASLTTRNSFALAPTASLQATNCSSASTFSPYTSTAPTVLPTPTLRCVTYTPQRTGTSTPVANQTSEGNPRSFANRQLAGFAGSDFFIVSSGNVPELEQAVASANAFLGTYTIYLEPGLYFLRDRLLFQGQRTVIHGQNATLIAPSPNAADPTKRTWIITIAANSIVEINYVNFQSGSQPTGGILRGYGGAITNFGTLMLSDSSVTNNVAANGGGAIMNSRFAADLKIYRSTFAYNSAGGGGAVQVDGKSAVTITCSSFENNRAYYGGGILFVEPMPYFLINYNRFIGNQVAYVAPQPGGDVFRLPPQPPNEGASFPATRSLANNYWSGASPSLGGELMTTGPELTSDPTTNGSICAKPPMVMPPAPTVTPTPTITPTSTPGGGCGIGVPNQPSVFEPNCAGFPTPTPLPMSCPWGGIYDLSTAKCRYTYNRKKVVDYALKYASSACSFFCAYNYSFSVPGNNCSKGTDCSNFLSQAYFYGGLPLTQYWACRIRNGPRICEHLSGVRAFTGAIFERVPINEAADFLKGELPDYFSNLGIITGSNGLTVDSTTISELMLQPPDPFPRDGRKIDLVKAASNASAVGRALAQQNIGFGDIFGSNDPSRQHTALIVGWGPPVTNWEELRSAQTGITSYWTELNTVPYVVDHGPHGEFALDPKFRTHPVFRRPLNYTPELLSGPRPYYALIWKIDIGLEDYRLDNQSWNKEQQWYFIRPFQNNSQIIQFEVVQSLLAWESDLGFTLADLLTQCSTP